MKLRLVAVLLIPLLAPAQVAKFRVRESAGLRRFNFPVRTTIRASDTSLALFENDKQIPAQFTAKAAGSVEIDFNASPGPWESANYRVEKATAAANTPNPFAITQANGAFTVKIGAQQYVVPENLTGLFSQANGGTRTYLRPGGIGLMINSRDGAESHIRDAKGTVTKRGPLVGALRFESAAWKSVVEMEFPRSKSWVEVRWTVDDPLHVDTAMTVDMNLLIEGAQAVVDFGANDTVYGALKGEQRFTLSAGGAQPGEPQWLVLLNEAVYASGIKTIAEGWTHVMDKERATAVAVESFGNPWNDHIQVSANGNLEIRRSLTTRNPRTLHFWLHFVAMPVQIGAATSPQAILSPLVVEQQ